MNIEIWTQRKACLLISKATVGFLPNASVCFPRDVIFFFLQAEREPTTLSPSTTTIILFQKKNKLPSAITQ